jgi:phosphatidylglycerol lysyltransferase
MKALGLSASIESCIAGYVIATLFYVISPFLRGLGAVEVSMILLITSYGFSETQAISITILYRIFEFWTPLIAGIGSFLFNRGNILLEYFQPYFWRCWVCQYHFCFDSSQLSASNY